MDATIQLYTFARSGASIYIALIEGMTIQPGAPGQQAVALRLRVEQTLWGEAGTPIRRAEFTQPDNEVARLKFPHPIWGRVNPREGARVFMVTHALGEFPADPVYVEEIVDADDVVLRDISNILNQERLEQDPLARKARYLGYLVEGDTVERLFGAEALAKDRDLPEVDRTGQVAIAMAVVFDSDESVYVRLSVGAWMWENIYRRTNAAGKIAVINAMVKGLEDASPDLRRFSLDHLTKIDPVDLRQPDVIASPMAIHRLQEQMSQETAPEILGHIQKLINALKG